MPGRSGKPPTAAVSPARRPSGFPRRFDPATAKDILQLRRREHHLHGGLLTATTFIQRLNTQGGTQPPAAECKEQTLGKVKEVPYKADYVFFKKTA